MKIDDFPEWLHPTTGRYPALEGALEKANAERAARRKLRKAKGKRSLSLETEAINALGSVLIAVVCDLNVRIATLEKAWGVSVSGEKNNASGS